MLPDEDYDNTNEQHINSSDVKTDINHMMNNDTWYHMINGIQITWQYETQE